MNQVARRHARPTTRKSILGNKEESRKVYDRLFERKVIDAVVPQVTVTDTTVTPEKSSPNWPRKPSKGFSPLPGRKPYKRRDRSRPNFGNRTRAAGNPPAALRYSPERGSGGVAYIPHRRGFRKGKDSKDRTMRNGWFISGMLLWGMLLGTAPAQSREPAAVRVMTYNIQYGNGASLEEIAALIREQNPDSSHCRRSTAKRAASMSPRASTTRISSPSWDSSPACSRFTARRFRLPEVFTALAS